MPIDDALEEIRRNDELKELLELKKQAEKELKKHKIEEVKLNEQLDRYKKELETISSNQQDGIIKAYLRGLSNFWPEKDPKDKIDEAVINLVTSPDFIEIYKNTLILRNPVRRFEYIIMKGLQKGIVNTLMNFTKFFSKLAPLGLNIICPYFEYKTDRAKGVVLDKCLIDGGEGTDALCDGAYYSCDFFKDRTTKFVTGELPYVKTPKTFKAPELQVPEPEREKLERDLSDEIEKYWRDP